MAEPGFVEQQPAVGAWYQLCTCGHPWSMHDVDSLNGDNPSCCYDTCPCGPGSYFAAQDTAGYDGANDGR